MNFFHAALLGTCLFAANAPAQTFYTYPIGTEIEWGGSGNTIPFWGGSATYQQVFDNAHMSKLNAGNVIVMTNMFFRARGSIPARSATVQLKFNHTSVTSAKATATFATNLQSTGDPSPTTVIAYKRMSFPAFSGTLGPGVPVGMHFPLDLPFLWTPAQTRSFVYELRYKDGSPGVQNSQLDAVDGNTFTSTRRPSEGTGCLATGQTRAASAMSTLAFGKGSSSFPAWNYTVSLANGAAGANGFWFVGLTRQKLTLPGACESLLLNPLAWRFGITTAPTGGSKPTPGGAWTIHVPVPRTPDFRLLPRFELLSQFAFEDGRLSYGLGLSNMTVVKTSFPGAVGVSRIFASTNQPGNGQETATTGSKGAEYGLVTGFQ